MGKRKTVKHDDKERWLVSFTHSRGSIKVGDVVTDEHREMFGNYLGKCKYTA